MKVGIVHGAGVNPDGSLQLHTRARADKAVEAYRNSIVDMLIVSGRSEAEYIATYLLKEGVNEKDVIIEPFSCSTLSNLFYCKMLLSILDNLEPVRKVCPISNYWHIPRLSYDARNILEGYSIECLPAPDPRSKEEIGKDKRLEILKFIWDKMLLYFGYGKGFDKERFLVSITIGVFIPSKPSEILEISANLATTPYQRELMRLERILYKMMKVI